MKKNFCQINIGIHRVCTMSMYLTVDSIGDENGRPIF